MTDANLIADLIRAGLAPELVQRVHEAVASRTVTDRHENRHETSRNVTETVTAVTPTVTFRDEIVTERHGPMTPAERAKRYRERRAARKIPDIASINADAGDAASEHKESPSRERDASRDGTQACLFLPILSSSLSIQEKEGSKERMHARARGDPAFDHFWDRYPHKVGKQSALKAWARVKQSGAVTFEELMAALERYRRKTDDRPWCNPSTWLNQGRWEDVPNEVNSNGKSILAAIDRARERIGGNAANYVPGSLGPPRLDLGEVPTDFFKLSKG